MDGEGKNTKLGRPSMVPGEKHTKERIFNAAVDLFAQDGYDRTSVRQIARAVGLTEGSVYRHYPNKEAVLEAIFAYAEGHIYAPLPIESTVGAEGGESVFRGLLSPLPGIIMSDPMIIKIARIMYAEMQHNDKIRHYFLKEYVNRADDYTERLFRECIDRKTIRECDPRALAQVFNAFRSEWIFQTFIGKPEGPFDLDRIEKALDPPIRLFEQLLVPAERAPRRDKPQRPAGRPAEG